MVQAIEPIGRVRIDSTARRTLERAVREGYPHETCGVMVGRQADGTADVRHVRQARNVNVERAGDRYELAPEDMLRIENEAREQGLEIVGIWHSHPDHPARPSETDLAAAWQGWSYVIVSVTSEGVADLRSWRLDGDRVFREEEIES